eukprot:751227-Pyramimonas_sp.AAC.1
MTKSEHAVYGAGACGPRRVRTSPTRFGKGPTAPSGGLTHTHEHTRAHTHTLKYAPEAAPGAVGVEQVRRIPRVPEAAQRKSHQPDRHRCLAPPAGTADSEKA